MGEWRGKLGGEGEYRAVFGVIMGLGFRGNTSGMEGSVCEGTSLVDRDVWG